MAGQGRTVDHSLVLVDGPIDTAGLYVPMTRGRLGNDVWVVIDPSSPADAVDVLAEVVQCRWVDEPAIEHLPTQPAVPEVEWASTSDPLAGTACAIIPLSAEFLSLMWLSAGLLPKSDGQTTDDPVADHPRIGVLQRRGERRHTVARHQG